MKRSILTSKGYTYSQDMQVVVGNAAVAIAQRNAICKVVPQVLIASVVKEVQEKHSSTSRRLACRASGRTV